MGFTDGLQIVPVLVNMESDLGRRIALSKSSAKTQSG